MSLRILVLGDDSRSQAGTLRDHLRSFGRYSRHRVHVFNPIGVEDSPLELDAFDAIVLHYSLVITADAYLSPRLRDRISRYTGLKVQFLQDEYRWVDDITAMMRHLGIDVLFSIVPQRELDNVYGDRLTGVDIIPTLAGYIPEDLVGRNPPTLDARPIDIGYRGRVLPYWNGALAQEKVRIARGVLERIGTHGLRHDIAWSESDRIYGERWNRFLMSCRTTLGTESGTSITDFDGSIERSVRAYLANHPGATFEQVSEAVLAPWEANVMMNVVSPRLFEAAALRTAMVLFPGEYGGIVSPWEHYIPLDKDFSNFDEVVSAIKDDGILSRITSRAYEDIVSSDAYSLRRFVGMFDDVVEERASARAFRPAPKLVHAHLARARRTGSLRGYNLRTRAHRVLEWAITARVVLQDPAVRKVAASYVRDASLRKRVRPGRVGEDLLRLGLMRRAHAGRPVTLEQFWLSAATDASRTTLTLVSRGEPSTGAASPVSVDWRSITSILWDSRDVAPAVNCRYAWRRWLGLAVGFYGESGIHHFGSLTAIAETDEAAVRRALEPLLEPPPQPTRAHPVRARTRRRRPRFATLASGARRALNSPAASAAKIGLLGTILAKSDWFRSVFRTYRRSNELREHVSLASLMEDMLKLHVLREAIAGRVAAVPGIDVCTTEDRTIARTVQQRGQAGPPIELDPAKTLVWDNSTQGGRVPYPLAIFPSMTVNLGETGKHTFTALSAVLEALPEPVARQALMPPLGANNVRHR